MKKILPFAFLVAGCGGATTPSPTSAPVPSPQPVPGAVVTGQYNLVLTSENGQGTTTIYTDFTQTGKTFTGAASTLACPSNDLSQCIGDDSANSIIPAGTVSGAKVSLLISFPTKGEADTVTLVGTATGLNLGGTYTDSLGDTGSWSGFPEGSLSGSYDGTFNSTPNPLPIAPTIVVTLAQDSSFNLTGAAMITSSPCISSLNFSGQAIGQAFSLTDAANHLQIIAIPTGNNFTFRYNFDSAAPRCAGDFGLGELTIPNPWDY